MLDFSIDFRRMHRTINIGLLTGILAFTAISPLHSMNYLDGPGAVPKHYEHEWFERYFDSIDEDTELGEMVDFLVSFKSSMEMKGQVCPSLVDLMFQARDFLRSNGVEVDQDEFEMIHQEILSREIVTSSQTFYRPSLRSERPNIELVKKHKHKKDKKGGEVKVKGKTIFGFIKCIAGGLICIIPIPAAQAVGAGLIVNGINDMVDGAREQGDENEQQQRMDEQRRREAQQFGTPN